MFKNNLKSKKLLTSALLLLIVFNLALPKQALAAWWEWFIPGWNAIKLFKTIFTKGLSGAVAELFAAIVKAVGVILVTISSAFLGIAQQLLSWITSPGFIGVKFTDNVMVNNGWLVARDLANMFIILGFVVVGLATILRIREYEAQKKLVPLIIIAILINFSKLFTGIVIDAANITMKHFLEQGGAFSLNFVNALKTQLEALTNAPEDSIEVLGIVVGFVFFNIIGSVTFLVLAFLFLIRYVMLWILVILSPLAFFFWVFDFTKRFWSMWLNSFIQWAFIGVPAAFFFWLADMTFTQSLVTPPSQEGIPGLFGYLLPVFILIAGLLVSIQLGGAGAGVFRRGLGILSGAGAAAGGAVVGAALSRLKESKPVEATRRGIGRGLETVGLRKAGGTSQIMQKEKEVPRARLERLYKTDPERVKRIASGGRVMGKIRSPVDQAAAAAVLANEGKLEVGDPGQLRNYQRAIALGYDVKEAEKKNPELARYNKRKMEKIRKETTERIQKARIAAGEQPLTKKQLSQRPELQETALQIEAVKEATKDLTPGDAAKLSPKALSPTVVTSLTPRHIQTMGRRGSTELVNELKKLKFKKDSEGRLLPLAQQTEEFRKVRDEVESFPPGPEKTEARKKLAAILHVINTDTNFR